MEVVCQGILMLEPIPRCFRPARRAVLMRWLPLVLAAGTLCHVSLAAALGLGDLTLRSYLNQPLKADIVLTDTAGLEASEVTASIASAEDYARAGVDRVFFLNDLRFTADFSGAQKVIRVTSSKAVTEPYLSFLVQVNRPGGQLLRTFTVLLDPPGTVALPAEPSAAVRAASPSRPQAAAPAKAPATARPAASKPAATTAGADAQTQRALAQLQERLQNLQTEVDAKDQAIADLKNQLQLAHQAAPVAAAIAASTPAPGPAGASVPAAVSTAAVASDPGTAPVAAPTTTPAASTPAQPVKAVPPAPVAAAPIAVAPAPTAVDDFDWLPVLGAVALLLLLALLLLRRRQRQRGALADPRPVPGDDAPGTLATPALMPDEALVVEPSVRSLPQQEPVAPVRRDSAPATDALDGASIYIAYGRFNEAIGILREGLAKQPERVDLRFRLLEVLGQQGDLSGFEEEERAALATGVTPERIQQIRAQSPKLETAQAAAKAASVAATALAATAAAVAASPALAPREPEPSPALEAELDSNQPVGLAMNAVAEPDFDFDLDAGAGADDDLELLASHQPTELAADEFQLNLDDLSMDADWEMVSPFEPAAIARKPLAEEPAEEPSEWVDPPAVDPLFATSLRELPEVYETTDEQFLSDFADLDDLGGFDDPALDTATVEAQPLPGDPSDGGDEFLARFMSDADLPDLEGMSLDFDSLDSQQASAEKLEQAQALIQQGDFHSASELLQGLLRDGDPTCQASARELLASLR
jgi:FimV-like protein